MFCSCCGTELLTDSVFCYHCGSQTIQSRGGATQAPPQPPPPSPASFSAPATHSVVAEHTGLSTPGIWSIVCSIVALIILPPVFGGLAIYLAYRAKKLGDRAGDTLMIMAVLALIVGMIIGAITWTSVNS